jgi:hypothetical protein
VPTFADIGCHVVSVTDPYGQWTQFQTHYLSENLEVPGIEPGPLARNSDHWTTNEVTGMHKMKTLFNSHCVKPKGGYKVHNLPVVSLCSIEGTQQNFGTGCSSLKMLWQISIRLQGATSYKRAHIFGFLHFKHKRGNTYWVHFEVNKLSSSQSNYNLTLVHGAFNYGLLSWCFPFIYTLVCPDMTNAIWIYLGESSLILGQEQ